MLNKSSSIQTDLSFHRNSTAKKWQLCTGSCKAYIKYREREVVVLTEACSNGVS